MYEAERGNAVRRIAREGDPDRSLAVLFAPFDVRDDLFALYAFNVELARIAEQVSEPDLGAIRLQWWREAIEGAPTGHPVADAFSETCRRRALSPARIEALLAARGFEIANKVMPDWPTLEAYLDGTAGELFALTAEILGASRDEPIDALCDVAGQSYGLTGLMRSLPIHASAGRVFLPADLLHSHGTSPERLFTGDANEGLKTLLGELRQKARDAQDRAMRHLNQHDASIGTSFRPLSLVEPYLAALAKIGGDPLRHIARINPLYRLWRMARWQ